MAEKVTLVVFSGEMDRALAAFNIAIGAVSMGMEVSMFFTFWGLNIIKKDEGPIKSKGIMRKMLNFMNRGGAKRLPLSKFHMFGLGKWMMGKLMREAKVVTVPGSAFGPTGEGHIRMSYCFNREEIEEAFDRIESWWRKAG
jgi:peroxiredoxin family protein